jgi:hypothetical protein
VDSYELASSWIELVIAKFSRASRSEAYCVVGLNSIRRFLRKRFEISDITLCPNPSRARVISFLFFADLGRSAKLPLLD